MQEPLQLQNQTLAFAPVCGSSCACLKKKQCCKKFKKKGVHCKKCPKL